MKLNNKQIVLTGASGGIGQAIARALVTQGARVILVGRNAPVLNKLCDELDGLKPGCEVIVADTAIQSTTAAF